MLHDLPPKLLAGDHFDVSRYDIPLRFSILFCFQHQTTCRKEGSKRHFAPGFITKQDEKISFINKII